MITSIWEACARASSAPTFALVAIVALIAQGCGGSSASSGADLAADCETLCGKVSAAGCASPTCESSCEDTSSVPSSCTALYDALIACGASSGTVGCTSSGDSIGGCESQAAAVAACVNGGGTSCPAGSYTETCEDIDCTGGDLTAACRAEDGSYSESLLPLPCSYVSNCNGQLTCSASC